MSLKHPVRSTNHLFIRTYEDEGKLAGALTEPKSVLRWTRQKCRLKRHPTPMKGCFTFPKKMFRMVDNNCQDGRIQKSGRVPSWWVWKFNSDCTSGSAQLEGFLTGDLLCGECSLWEGFVYLGRTIFCALWEEREWSRTCWEIVSRLRLLKEYVNPTKKRLNKGTSGSHITGSIRHPMMVRSWRGVLCRWCEQYCESFSDSLRGSRWLSGTLFLLSVIFDSLINLLACVSRRSTSKKSKRWLMRSMFLRGMPIWSRPEKVSA